MHIYKKRVIPQREEEVFSEMVCDFCGNKSNRKDWPANINKADNFNRIETTVEIKIIENYPESYECRSENYHFCPQCFKKLREWLEGQGVLPTYNEYSNC